MENISYWEYKIVWLDSYDCAEKVDTGITIGETMAVALARIEEYYGEVMNILRLRSIGLGGCLDFCTFKDEEESATSFTIVEKENE